MVLRVPPLHRVLVVLVEQQPLLPAGSVGPGPHQHEAPEELVPGQVQMKLPLPYGAGRIDGLTALVELPRSLVPDDDVSPSVLACRNDPFEVQILDRVVFDVERSPPRPGIQGGPLGHRPAGEHPFDLQTEVVVEPARPVTLDDESPPVRRRRRGDRAGGLAGLRKVPFAPVRVELVTCDAVIGPGCHGNLSTRPVPVFLPVHPRGCHTRRAQGEHNGVVGG
jgi:hypothetical protein